MQRQASRRPQVIDVTNPRHLAWWAAEFGVSEDAVVEMVHIVGDQARVVEYYLGLRELHQRQKTLALAQS